MSLFEFFFPQVAQAEHLRTIARRGAFERKRKSIGSVKPSMPSRTQVDRIAALEADLGLVSLVLAGVLAKLDEHGHVSQAELKELLTELDGLDGVQDGRLDISVLRGQVD